MNTPFESQPLLADRAKTREGLESAEPDTLRLRKILVPLDLSECSRPALRYAAPVARQFGATITLLHAALPPKLATAKMASDLIEIGRQEFGADFGVDAIMRQGEPVEEIVAAASELNIDLIIISTHGYSGLKHALHGSIAERVLQAAPCPVCTIRKDLLLRRNVDALRAEPWKTIVAPVDFSECSRYALRFAGSLARRVEARLTLFHVVELAEAHMSHPLLSFHVIRAMHRADASAKLQRWAQEDIPSGVPVSTIVRIGVPSFELIERALGLMRSDLLVMGTHNYSWWKGLMEGGSTKQLVRHAPCAVISLREALNQNLN